MLQLKKKQHNDSTLAPLIIHYIIYSLVLTLSERNTVANHLHMIVFDNLCSKPSSTGTVRVCGNIPKFVEYLNKKITQLQSYLPAFLLNISFMRCLPLLNNKINGYVQNHVL